MKAHRTDMVSFAFGLSFLALAAWWLLAQILGLALPPVGWFLAGALILTGVLGLVGALRSGRHANRESTGRDPVEHEVAAVAPGEGGAGAEATGAADEWSTEAVADVPVAAVEDRPVSGPGGEPHWSPTPPVTPDGPVTGPPDGENRPRG